MVRAKVYGEHLAEVINYIIRTLEPEEREEYKSSFVKGMCSYQLKPRKECEPKNPEDVPKLDELCSVEIKNPDDLVKIISEGLDLMYHKRTAKNVIDVLLEKLN